MSRGNGVEFQGARCLTVGCRLLGLRTEFGEEVHLEGVGELRRRAEGEIDVLMQHLRDVRTRHLHAPRKFCLRHAKLLHPPQYPPQKHRPNPVYRFHNPIAFATMRPAEPPIHERITLRPYVAAMLRNIRRFGDICNQPIRELLFVVQEFAIILRPPAPSTAQSQSAHSSRLCNNDFRSFLPLPCLHLFTIHSL